MSIMRWDPARELAAAQGEMRRLLESLGVMGSEGGSQRGGSWFPAMDVREEGEQIVVEMELAGVRQEDVDIEIENGTLTVSGQRQQEQREESNRQIRVERRFGSFTRTLPLPQGTDEESIQAEMRDGLLELRIPKPAQPQPRRVEIGGGSSRPRTIDAGNGNQQQGNGGQSEQTTTS
jgi:HSP20 family protein